MHPGTTRVWLPVPDVETEWQHSSSHSWTGNATSVIRDGQEIYRGRIAVDEGLRRIEQLYKPYHAAVRKTLARIHVMGWDDATQRAWERIPSTAETLAGDAVVLGAGGGLLQPAVGVTRVAALVHDGVHLRADRQLHVLLHDVRRRDHRQRRL